MWLIEPTRWKGVGRWLTSAPKGTEHFECLASLAESEARYLAFDVEHHKILFGMRCTEGTCRLHIDQQADGRISLRVVAGGSQGRTAAFQVLTQAATWVREVVDDVTEDCPHEPNFTEAVQGDLQ